jgi:flagellar biogenesis protein FliO
MPSAAARLVLVLLLGCGWIIALGGEAAMSAPAPSTAPAPEPEMSVVLHRPSARPSGGATTAPAAPVAKLSTGLDIKRIAWSLAIVIALILALRWGARFVFPSVRTHGASSAIRVLSRNMISPKQQVLIVQVGRRLIVVGDCGQQMNTLSEITDADEVASLIGQIRDERSEPVSRTFSTLFGGASSAFQTTEKADSGSEHAASDDLEEEAEEQAETDSTLVATRQELSGLMDKVRMLSRQFHRT